MTRSQAAGVIFLVLSSLCFVSLDVTSQFAVGATVVGAVSVWLAVFARYSVQAASMAVLLLPTRGKAALATAHPKFQLARGALLTATSILGISGLKYLPIAEFTAIVMLTPLLVSALAVRFLGERMSRWQWALLVASFCGAVVVARPSGAVFGWALLFPLASLACYSVFQLLTRKLAQTEDPLVMHFYTGLVGTVAATFALPWALQPLQAHQWLLLLGIGFWGTLGHYLLIQAFRRSAASQLAPFLYLQVVFAVVAGWLAFGRVPDALTGLGIALIVAGGAASAWLGAKRARAAQV